MLRVACVPVLCIAVGVGAVLHTAVSYGQDSATASRTWSDVSGKFKITGKFVSLENNVVTLKQDDGEEIEIPLDKLSLVDRGFARKAAESASDSPFKPKSANPFKPKMSKDGDAGEPSGDEPSGDEPANDPPVRQRTVTVNWNTATAADPQPQQDKWEGAVTAAQLSEGATSLKAKTARLPNRRDFFEKARDVVFNPSGQKAAIGYTLQKPGSRDATTRILLLDTTTGKSLGSAEIENEYIPLGLEEDGRRLLVRKAEFGFGNNDELEVWTLGRSGMQRGLHWIPYDDQQHGNRDIHWGRIVSDGRALTMSAGGRLVLWDLDSAEPVWYLDVKGAHEPAVSANGNYLAYQAEKAVGLLEVESGTVLALLPTEDLMLSTLAFSPDGKSLAGSSVETLWVWDVESGGLTSEVNVRNFGGLRNMFWADSEHVLLADQWLIHVASRIPVWQYTGGSPARIAGGITWFYISPHGGGEGLVGAALPHSAAKSALETAMKNPDFFLLQPGSTVSIDATGIPDGDRAKVTAMLVKNLDEAGFKVAAGAPVSVRASMQRGKTREIEYRTFGSFSTSRHNVQEYNLKLAFVTDGKTAWETGTLHVAAPFMVNLKEGQTIDQLLKEQDKPGYEFFERMRLPKFVPRPSDKPVLGISAISMQGVR